ncbi:MAG: DUF2157 domain-containing protein [Chitinophagaceae bacterium]|nr:DUF2157 domain-containing protein [Chitinophagaceae bacterium]
MEVDKEGKELLQIAISRWRTDGIVTDEQAQQMEQSVHLRSADRQQVAQYFFFIALFCILLAFGAIFLSEKLLERIKAYFSWNDLVIAGLTAVLSGVWFWYIGRRRGHTRGAAYEIYMALGGLSVLTSLVYLCKWLHADTTYYTTFLSLAFPSLLVIAATTASQVLWLGGLVAATFWFGAFTSVYETGYLFLGMNYPVRYVLFGALVLGASFAIRPIGKLAFAHRLTYVSGLALFFLALWAVSIFGNFNSFERWQHARQLQIVIYSVFLAIAAGLSFFFGIRYSDAAARDFGVLFLLINLYTRYFEYFWDAMNKGVFFLILAVTFGLLGRWLERKSRAGAKKSPGS